MEVVYSIRTEDDRIVVFDEEVQVVKDGEEYNEFFITDKDIALIVLAWWQKENPETKFKLVETNIDELKIEHEFTMEEVHEKAVEKSNIRRD